MTREYIIERSAKLFIELGVKAVRMDDIASHLAVSKRTIYELFSDKREMVAAALNFVVQKQKRERHCLSGANNLVEEIVKTLQQWENHAEDIKRFISDVYRFYPGIHADFVARHREEDMNIMRTKLEEGVKQGFLVENLNIELTLFVMIHSIEALVLGEKFTQPPGVTRSDVFRFIVTYHFRGIMTEKGRVILDDYLNNT